MPDTPLIQFKGIGKRFPGVQALRNVSFDVARGSCHALCGENGAGKSTLGKILAGIYAPDEGELVVDGEGCAVWQSQRCDGRRASVSCTRNWPSAKTSRWRKTCAWVSFPQRPRLFRVEKCCVGRRNISGTIRAKIDPNKLVGKLPVSQQQLVQIAAAVSHGARILIFDEPTSSLSQIESEHLFELIKQLQQKGVTAIYVSHRMEEIYRLCDAITVLRDGQHVGTKSATELQRDELVKMMIGRSLEAYFPGHLDAQIGEELLRVENLSSPGRFDNISFRLRAGEVLGFAGLVGAGRTEIAEALFGLDRLATGRVYVNGKPMPLRHPSVAMNHRIGMVPEDRKRHGLVLIMNARENTSLPTLERFASLGWVHAAMERRTAQKYFELLRVKAPSTESVVAGLSGGNQQKLVLGKWLAADCRVLIVDEPTRGVDVGAKSEIHGLIDTLAKSGNGVLLISSELPEVINLSTRILVLRNGKLVDEISRAQATQETLMRLMAGMRV